MKLNMAALCDRATIREGLLHILGAGVTQCSVVPPGTVDIDLALLVGADDWQDLVGRHTLKITVTHQDSPFTRMAELIWEAPEPSQEQRDQPLPQVPVVVPIRGMGISQEGGYQVRIEVDDTELSTITFSVTKAHLPGVTQQLS